MPEVRLCDNPSEDVIFPRQKWDYRGVTGLHAAFLTYGWHRAGWPAARAPAQQQGLGS